MIAMVLNEKLEKECLMKSIRPVGQGKIVCEDVEVPSCGNDEVLIKTAVTALCGSELAPYRGEGVKEGNSGHEAAGTVVQVGEDVENIKPGQRVGVSAIVGCGECDYCNKGQFTWCSNFKFYGNMHAEYFVVAENGCHVLPDDMSWDVGVLISGDGMGVPYHSYTKMTQDVETVAVFGLGPIGLGNVLLQSFLGRKVIGVDLSEERLELAKSLGATHTIPVLKTDGVVKNIRAITDGMGADVCIEAAGLPITAKQCFSAVRTGGQVIFNGEQPSVELSPSEDFIRRDISAVGAWFYHFCEFKQMLDLYCNGLKVDSLITHRFPLEQADQAYREMAAGKTGKVILEIGL